MSFVIDNSVALAWCFEDEHTDAVMAVLDNVVETGAVAPLIWPLEALNGLIMAERRSRIDASKRALLISFLRQLPIALDDETAYQTWDATSRLAERYRLTAYDAAYLELAVRRKLPLASLDRDLRRAGLAIGIELLGQ